MILREVRASAASVVAIVLLGASPAPSPAPSPAHHGSSRTPAPRASRPATSSRTSAPLRTAAAPARPAPRGVPVPRTPSTPQHSEFTVLVNKKGQVVKATGVKPAQNDTFNAMTYGNVLQSFIRRPDGTAIAGTYRMTYDYDPAKKTVRRQVALLRAGGVDPNALGAVDQELQKLAAERAQQKLHAPPTPSPLPDLKAITGHRH